MDTIKITLETLYDILRNEKKREDLQKLDQNFFLDVLGYLREKKSILDLKKNSDELFAAGERDKLEYELRSIRRILKEIYEKREKKIIDIALNRSRTGSDIIDTSSMLLEEREFYDQILNNLDHFRRGVLLNLFQGKLPSTAPSPFIKFESTPALDDAGDDLVGPLNTSPSSEITSVSIPIKPSLNTDPAPPKIIAAEPKPTVPLSTPANFVSIKFVHAVPSFVWKDMKVYGPFDTGETTSIFPEIAELLVRKGRAEKV